jgi:adenylyltransferase/sulfurtransferase
MSNTKLSDNELHRYRRQLILPDWSNDTQLKLKNSSVLVAGVGGLGCGAALNLVEAGVGHIRICDADVVEISNLNRQFLHKEKNIGVAKTASGYETLHALNSGITIEQINEEINETNVDQIVGDTQIILDCFDNFPGRYILNKCALKKNIPMVHAAIWGMEGRVTFLHPPETPCFSCLFPQAPAKAELPVLGAVACTTGSMQAIEAIKYLTGTGKILKGRMMIMDSSTMRFMELQIQRKHNCPVCSNL